jgi:hypothetical protein
VKCFRFPTLLAVLLASASGFAQSSLIRIPLDSRSNVIQTADDAYLTFAKKVEQLSIKTLQSRSQIAKKPLSSIILPGIVRLTQNGRDLPVGGRTRGVGITLDIDPAFNTATTPNRVAFMQSVYDTAKPTIEAIFGDAAISGTVRVRNMDSATLSNDRRIIVGGYYLPNNGSGQREIRLGDYNADETMAVSLIHTILLAYLPDPAYGFDAYLEGIARAAVQRIVRIPAALPAGLSQAVIETTLENSYEIGEAYDWANQKALSGPQFIAPNLLNAPIPDGTLGGLFLARYKMSGSAWQKVLTEFPNFIKDLNAALKTNPGSASTQSGLEGLLATVLGPGAQVEGLPVAQWLAEQKILQTNAVPGLKLYVQPIPITTGLATNDFGVFLVESTAFTTQTNGDEFLNSGTSYPVFWDEAFNRISAGATDQMDFVASYGNVTPNFPNKGNNIPYRVSIDIAFQDRLVRSYVPAGAIASATSSTISNLYGTYVGPAIPSGNTLVVRVVNGSETLPDLQIRDGAFGGLITSASFNSSRSLVFNVIRRDSLGNETTVLTRRINKGPGALGVTLGDAPSQTVVFPSSLNAGLQLFGLIGDPLSTDLANTLAPQSGLFARYNPARTSFDFYPNFGLTVPGFGYFARMNSTAVPSYRARVESNVPTAVALRPGWNMVSVPGNFTQSLSSLLVVRARDFPILFGSASSIVGNTVFQFDPGLNNGVTGVPETGTYSAATTMTPGRGYFIRCLSPEGALLVFSPNASTGGKTLSIPSNTVHCEIIGQNEATRCVLGQSNFATSGFDLALDSGLPPLAGGLQVRVDSTSEPRYKDFRPFATNQSFAITVTGLTPGKLYHIRTTQVEGRSSQYTIRSKNGLRNAVYNLPVGGTTFIATGAEMNFDIVIRGARL